VGLVLRPLDDPQNRVVKSAARLGVNREARERTGQALLEGRHAIEEALSHEVPIRTVIYSARVLDRPGGRELLDRAMWAHARMIYVTDRVLDVVTQVDSHQGIAAVVAHDLPFAATTPPAPVLVLEAVQDPGNLGALIRSAVAFGFRVGVTRGSVDPFNPKAIRASAALMFRAGLFRLDYHWEVPRGTTLVATAADGDIAYTDWDWSKPTVLVVGNEGSGVSPDTGVRAAARLRIPMMEGVESLNVAAAGAIIMADAHRRRLEATREPTPAPKRARPRGAASGGKPS
jgi:TrmH family RNA methyltransferase